METDHTKAYKDQKELSHDPLRADSLEKNMAESARESDPDAKLMSEVQIYDCLFNKYSRDFKDKYKKLIVGKKSVMQLV